MGQVEELVLEGRAVFGGVEGYGGLFELAGAFLSLSRQRYSYFHVGGGARMDRKFGFRLGFSKSLVQIANGDVLKK